MDMNRKNGVTIEMESTWNMLDQNNNMPKEGELSLLMDKDNELFLGRLCIDGKDFWFVDQNDYTIDNVIKWKEIPK